MSEGKLIIGTPAQMQSFIDAVQAEQEWAMLLNESAAGLAELWARVYRDAPKRLAPYIGCWEGGTPDAMRDHLLALWKVWARGIAPVEAPDDMAGQTILFTSCGGATSTSYATMAYAAGIYHLRRVGMITLEDDIEAIVAPLLIAAGQYTPPLEE